jgi:xylulokinase
MGHFLGIDIGTSSCKSIVIDESGEVISEFQREYQFEIPYPGWTEQNPNVWQSAVNECLKSIPKTVEAIGLTGQMHGSVFLDASGDVIRPAILWNDQRTVKETELIKRHIGLQKILSITCNPPLTGFQVPKVLWLRSHEPQAYSRLHSLLLPKDYVQFCLTGEKATDVSDASGTGVFDVPKRSWSSEMITKLDLNPGWFPPPYESTEVVGTWNHIPVVAGAGDQAAGGISTGAIEPGVISISLGTSGVVFHAQQFPYHDELGRVHTFCHATGAWHSMGVVLSCGGALHWAKDVFRFNSFEEMAQLAASARATSMKFYPYLAGERTPYNDPTLTARMDSVSLADGREEFCRAIFEGITFALCDAFEAVASLVPDPVRVVRVTGGGAKSKFWMKLLSSAMSIPCEIVQTHGPAVGAALLAGVGVGRWGSLEESCHQVVIRTNVVEPDVTLAQDLQEKRMRWKGSQIAHNSELC